MTATETKYYNLLSLMLLLGTLKEQKIIIPLLTLLFVS